MQTLDKQNQQLRTVRYDCLKLSNRVRIAKIDQVSRIFFVFIGAADKHCSLNRSTLVLCATEIANSDQTGNTRFFPLRTTT